ncbi:MAG: hypothetical protein ACR2FL_08090 [Nocardioidaceae bacterium]
MRRALTAFGRLGAPAAVLMALTACSEGSSDPEPGASPSAVTSLSSVKEIPGIVMIDKTWDSYRTAKITEVGAAVSGQGIDVNYLAGPEACSGFAGYATQKSGSTIQVTIVEGTDKGCKGEPTNRATVLPVQDGVGDSTVEISAYSAAAVAIT